MGRMRAPAEVDTGSTGAELSAENQRDTRRRLREKPRALIVAHGQPSAPAAPEAAIAALARAVAGHLPGWQVEGATLAAPGALEAALAALGPGAVPVYPLFMADGWFVSTRLPERLAAAGRPDCAVLPPFGLDPACAGLCLRAALEGARAQGLDPVATTLLLAAHGSPSDPRPAAAARALADAVARARCFRSIAVGFVDETPSIATAARRSGAGLCLPLFAAGNHHVRSDLPAALEAGGFTGIVLDPIGEHAAVPALIAAALTRTAAARAEAPGAGRRVR